MVQKSFSRIQLFKILQKIYAKWLKLREKRTKKTKMEIENTEISPEQLEKLIEESTALKNQGNTHYKGKPSPTTFREANEV